MMKNKINFKAFFKSLRHSLKNIGSDADKDWRIMLTLSFIIFLGVIVFHINLFLNIQNRLNDDTTDVSSNNRVVNSEALNKMVGNYEKRAEEYKKIEETQFQSIDPAR